MSNPVRVSVKGSYTVDVTKRDEVHITLGKDPIFQNEKASEIVDAVIREHGWHKVEIDDRRIYIKEDEESTSIWDVDNNTLTIKGTKKEQLTLEGEKTKTGDAWSVRDLPKVKQILAEQGKREIERKLKKQAKAQKAQIEEESCEELMHVLEVKLEERLTETREIITDIYKDWVRDRAKKLGNVTSETINESEDGKIFEMTIEIEPL